MSLPIDEQRLARIRADWQERAASPLGRFLIASQPDWSDGARWDSQAELDLALLTTGLPPEWLATARVLEIGCGLGRLAHRIAPRCRSYTGIDLCHEYLEEARRQRDPRFPTRFLQNDGVSLPVEVRDEQFDFIYSFAVFIHCPREIIENYIARAAPHLAPGGVFRFQVLADIHDHEGLAPPPESAPVQNATESAEPVHAYETERANHDANWKLLQDSQLVHLVTGTDYQGHLYTLREASLRLSSLAPDLTLYLQRFGPQFIVGEFQRSAAPRG